MPLCQILFLVNTPFHSSKVGLADRSYLPISHLALGLCISSDLFLFGIRFSIYAFHAKSLKLCSISPFASLSTLRLVLTHRLISITPASSFPPFETYITKWLCSYLTLLVNRLHSFIYLSGIRIYLIKPVELIARLLALFPMLFISSFVSNVSTSIQPGRDRFHFDQCNQVGFS